MSVTTARMNVDLFSDEVLTDPYPVYRDLRDAGSLVYLEGMDAWALPRYDQVRAALSDWKAFSSASGIGFNDAINSMSGGNLITSDPPNHQRLRDIHMEWLSPRRLRDFTDGIERLADATVRELVSRGSFDGVVDLARVFHARVVTDLIGMSYDVRDKLIAWADASFTIVGPMNARTQAALPLVGELLGLITSLSKDDLRAGSVGWDILDLVERGEISAEDGKQILWNFTAPSIDTTINAIGAALLHLGQNPEQWDLLRADRALVQPACNEVLRYEPPIQVWGRVATQEWDAGGHSVPAGARVVVMIASGNRDERHYPHADRFDIRRNARDQLAFGHGIHSCVGAKLARVELSSVLGALARHVTGIEVGEPVRHLNNTVRGLDSLPVSFV